MAKVRVACPISILKAWSPSILAHFPSSATSIHDANRTGSLTKMGTKRIPFFGQSLGSVPENEGGQLFFYCSKPLFIAFQAFLT